MLWSDLIAILKIFYDVREFEFRKIFPCGLCNIMSEWTVKKYMIYVGQSQESEFLTKIWFLRC